MAHGCIHKEARRIVRRCGTHDSFKIARELGIHVMFSDGFAELKGMYISIRRSRFIILNGNLGEHIQKTAVSHETGHGRFHRQLAKSKALQEFMLYDMTSLPEYEANIFASGLLIGDDEILPLISCGCGIANIAGELQVDAGLVLIKAGKLRDRGYDVAAPYRPHADFLR